MYRKLKIIHLQLQIVCCSTCVTMWKNSFLITMVLSKVLLDIILREKSKQYKFLYQIDALIPVKELTGCKLLETVEIIASVLGR